jgi:hypothetical protein
MDIELGEKTKKLEERSRSAFEIDWSLLAGADRDRSSVRPLLTITGSITALLVAVLSGFLLAKYGVGAGGAGEVRPRITGELLLADVRVQPAQQRAGEFSWIAIDAQGNYRIGAEQDFEMVIRSPRKGYATVVQLAPGRRDVRPREGGREIRVEAFQSFRYGPFRPPSEPTTVMVIITETPASEAVLGALPAHGAPPSQVDSIKIQSALRDVLSRAGHRWFVLSRINLLPDQEDGEPEE